MRSHSRLRGILWFFTLMLYLAVVFSVTFYLTGWLFRLVDLSPSSLVMQVINSLGGLILTGFSIGLLTRIFRSRMVDGEMRVFGPIIEALQRVAQGDFSVQVEHNLDQHAPQMGMIGKLVDNVNNMALELRQMETLRQEFISNVSHEIQSPLASIRGFVQALQNENLTPDEKRHYLSIIETESTRLSRITENLLKLATLESEHVKFEPKPYRLDWQIRDLVLACEPQWADKDLDMAVCLDEVVITADQDLLSQVWSNLIHNSIKFTSAGGSIQIDLHPQTCGVAFTIRDTGIGIAEDDRVHIFERFYKADKSRTRSNNGGSGLGLSIVHKIVDLHHGTISVESQPGVGTTFCVTLPAAQPGLITGG